MNLDLNVIFWSKKMTILGTKTMHREMPNQVAGFLSARDWNNMRQTNHRMYESMTNPPKEVSVKFSFEGSVQDLQKMQEAINRGLSFSIRLRSNTETQFDSARWLTLQPYLPSITHIDNFEGRFEDLFEILRMSAGQNWAAFEAQFLAKC
jgi:hypothetical protein